MPDPASEQGEHILEPVAGRVDRGAHHRRHRLGPDLLRRDPLPPAQRRRDPRADALQPAARDLLHDRPGHHGGRVLRPHGADPERRPRRTTAPPDNIIEVIGQQWSWTFNYGIGEMDNSADDDRTDDNFAYDVLRPRRRHRLATSPTLCLPVDETTRFNLHTPDVIHDFGVPGFLMKMDVVPGRVNHYVITPDPRSATSRASATSSAASTTRGCSSTSTSSAARTTTPTSRTSRTPAPTSDLPLLGGEDAYTQDGLDVRIRGGIASDRHRVAHPTTVVGARRQLGQQLVRVLTTTDHKVIGKLYLGTSFAWFLIGGLMAMLIRSELAYPGSRSSTTSSTTSCSRCTARSCCCCSRRRCSSASAT